MAQNNGKPVGDNQSLQRFPAEGYDDLGREVQITKREFPRRIDEVSDMLIYLGFAAPTTLESQPLWKIKRIRKIGNQWDIGFAEGDEKFEHIWNNRASLDYF
jgi:hypothetical protein